MAITADQIREHCKKRYVEPARQRDDKVVAIRSGDVQSKMSISGDIAQVCEAIGAQRFEKMCNMKMICVLWPYQGPETLFVFRLGLQPASTPQPAPSFDLTLGVAAYDQGSFNVPKRYDHLVGQGPVKLILGRSGKHIQAKVNRTTANLNRAPRIAGGTRLRDYFRATHKLYDKVHVDLRSPTEIHID